MDSGSCLQRILLLLVFLGAGFLQDSVVAFHWNHRLRNASTLSRCVGDDVTFRWSYVTGIDEKVLATFLFSDSNGTLVTGFANRVTTSSDRVTFLPPTGMTLTGLTSDDAGMYGVHVRLFGSGHLHTQVVNLVVLEPPKLLDGKLEVEQLQPKATAPTGPNATCASTSELQCGHFLTIGNPPVSVKWSDPDKQEHVSTVLENGRFLFDLPAYKGGNYTCTLVLAPEVSKCLQSDPPFVTTASIFLETTATKVEEQAANLQELKETVEQVRTQAFAVLKTHNPHFTQEMEDRLETLENSTESLALDMDTQRRSTQMLSDSNTEAITHLRNSFQRALTESEATAKQSLQDHAKDLLTKLKAATDAISIVRESSAAQQQSMQTMQQQLKALQSQFKDQQNVNSQLHSELATARNSLTRQKAATADLEDKVLKHQEENDQQKKINSDQKKVNSDQLRTITDLQSNLSAMAKRIEHLETVSAILQSKWAKQQQELETQKATSAEQERISAEFLPSLAAVQNGLEIQKNATDHLASQQTEYASVFDRKLSAVQKTVGGIQAKLDDVSTHTKSELESLGQNVNNTQINLTTALTTITSIRQRVGTNKNNLVQITERLTSLVERVNESDGNQQRSLSNQVALLQQNVSSIHRQYEVMLPRLATLESGLETVNGRIHHIRLVGGRNALEGRVEIRVGQRWGTVCDDNWDSNDAKVVCAMLGYLASGAVAKGSATFGQGTGPIVLDDVNCNGSEQDIRTCGSRAFGTHNCGHSEDAGVICAGY